MLLSGNLLQPPGPELLDPPPGGLLQGVLSPSDLEDIFKMAAGTSAFYTSLEGNVVSRLPVGSGTRPSFLLDFFPSSEERSASRTKPTPGPGSQQRRGSDRGWRTSRHRCTNIVRGVRGGAAIWNVPRKREREREAPAGEQRETAAPLMTGTLRELFRPSPKLHFLKSWNVGSTTVTAGDEIHPDLHSRTDSNFLVESRRVETERAPGAAAERVRAEPLIGSGIFGRYATCDSSGRDEVGTRKKSLGCQAKDGEIQTNQESETLAS